MINSNRFKDYSDQRFGRLVALNLSIPPRFNKQTYWTCKCDCGKVVDVLIRHCVDGVIKSCGCLQSENYAKNNPLKGRQMRVLSDRQLKKVKQLEEQKFSNRQIAKLFSVSPATIFNYLNKKK